MSSANTFIEEDGFGLVQRPSGKASNRRCHEIVRRYTMTNKRKSSVRLITWGAGIQAIKIPNDKGIFGDVVLGYDSMDGYLEKSYPENIIGKVTNNASDPRKTDNRTDRGDDEVVKRGLDNVNWEAYVLGDQVVMSNLSDAEVEGWSGRMLTQVKFAWTEENELHINIRATSTEPMPADITTRCLFNLAGHGTGPNELRNHVVTINAGKWTFLDVRDKVPNGAVRSVDSTIYDLRYPTHLTGRRLGQVPGGGYDHNLCVDAPSSWCYRFHARILHPGSGRFMEVYSNQPGIRFYTGNDLPEPGRLDPPDLDDCCWGGCGDRAKNRTRRMVRGTPGKDGVLYRRHGAFALSPQNYPNALNTDGFPPCILYPGKVYAHDITYKFGVLRKN